MFNDLFIISYIILFLFIVYLYRYYRYRSSIIENFKDEKNNLPNLLHDSMFLTTNKGIQMGGVIRDFGNIYRYVYIDAHIVKPDTINELQNIVEKAYLNKKKIRVRGGGTSSSGISIPKKGEILMDMSRMNKYNFDEVGTITVDSGVVLNDLKRFLDGHEFELPVYPDLLQLLDKHLPTIGGMICSGGISKGSEIFGGLWNNVTELTIVDGYGKKHIYNPNNEIFPWLFSNFGQLGIITSAKLKINHINKNKDFYPLGKKGLIEQFKFKLGDRPFFYYHILCPKESVHSSKKKLIEIIEKEYSTKEDKKNFEIDILYVKYKMFNPPLLYNNSSFYCIRAVKYIDKKDDIYEKKIKRIERDFLNIMDDNSLYRYPQIEFMDTDGLRDYYINRRVYDQFLIYKNRMDPHSILNYIDNFSEL